MNRNMGIFQDATFSDRGSVTTSPLAQPNLSTGVPSALLGIGHVRDRQTKGRDQTN
jgi:hypothetical protein